MKKKDLQPSITEGFWYDEVNHLYYFDGKPMTGCTTILNVISKPALVGWAAKMACEYIRNNSEMAVEGLYYVTEQDLADAQKAHAQKRDKAADEGTLLHSRLEAYINKCIETSGGRPLPLEETDPVYKLALWAATENIRFIASEKKLYSKELFVAGTADLIFEKDGKTYIGDLKCKDKIWSREPFLQCAGYALMWEEMSKLSADGLVGETSLKIVESLNKIDGYCVIRMKGDDFETLWSFDTEGDTNGFRAAVTLYRTMANFKATNTWKK